MKPKRKTSLGDAPKNSKDINSDLTGNGTYKGPIEGVIGTHRLLIRGKCDYVYVMPWQVEVTKQKYGKDFIRDLGEVKSDSRPQIKKTNRSYLV